MSSLWLAFDCRFHRKWDTARIARLTQKIGRLMRLHPGKPVSMYYYARDITDFYHSQKPRLSNNPEIIEGDYNAVPAKFADSTELLDDAQEDIAEAAGILAASIAAHADGAADIDPWQAVLEINPTRVEQVDVEVIGDPDVVYDGFSTKQITLASTPLYVLKDVRDHIIVSRRNFADYFGNSAELNKVELLRMAERREKSPNKHRCIIGIALCSYTSPSSGCYDPSFTAQIRKLAPHWFLDTAAANKVVLLEMASNREGRPAAGRHPLGGALFRYLSPKSKSYDPTFKQEVSKLAPHWLLDTAAANKIILLEMARNRDEKPVQRKHPLGIVLRHYMNPKSRCYDQAFTEQIRELAPHWFLDSTAANKIALLEMARDKEDRPVQKKHPLGTLLCSYTNPKSECYDPVFTQQIRKLAPQWFVETARVKKTTLLKMARKAEKRPKGKKHPLVNALINYTNPTNRCYDPVFTEEITRLAPHWFIDITAVNKAALLKMAKDGEQRPNQKKHPLGKALTRYTTTKSECYDTAFMEEIRRLAPQWFCK
jgi:hypothetical protein